MSVGLNSVGNVNVHFFTAQETTTPAGDFNNGDVLKFRPKPQKIVFLHAEKDFVSQVFSEQPAIATNSELRNNITVFHFNHDLREGAESSVSEASITESSTAEFSVIESAKESTMGKRTLSILALSVCAFATIILIGFAVCASPTVALMTAFGVAAFGAAALTAGLAFKSHKYGLIVELLNHDEFRKDFHDFMQSKGENIIATKQHLKEFFDYKEQTLAKTSAK